MRNRIYRAALVEGDITVEAPNHILQPPALLQVCRLVRNEATSIYYEENRMVFVIHDNDATLCIRWNQTFHQTTYAIASHPSANWKNLRVWLKATFHSQCGRPNSGPDQSAPRHVQVMAHLHILVARLRDESGVCWELAERLLEDAHNALIALDPAWE